MLIDDQRELLHVLADGAAFGRPGERVARIDTHSASIFLVGDDAYKLKRAVRYDYLDFSTVERRQRLCEAEVALNSRTAPTLYLGVCPITREPDGHLAVAGAGPAVDWLVHMRRFRDEDLLDRLAASGRLAVDLMPALADAVARLHTGASPCPSRGGANAMRWVLEGNTRGFEEEGHGCLDAALCRTVLAATRAEVERHRALLDARAQHGRMRACHGDLHLRNIVLLDGVPTPFDAIEFNDDLSCIDVLYDLAFLLMDLWRLGLRRHANEVFNQYVRATFAVEECDALALLPLFLSTRSAVRAKTSATASRLQVDDAGRRLLEAAARAYLAAARDLLQPPAVALVVIAGFSGTGKSTVARAIADGVGAPPGALILRSDSIRKRLAGVADTTRLPAEAYRSEMNRRVYDELGVWARRALSAGHSVVVDAVCAREEERRALEAIAVDAHARFAAVWLDAPTEVLMRRVTERHGDASDATAAVVTMQVARGAGTIAWPRVTASASASVVETAVRAELQRVL